MSWARPTVPRISHRRGSGVAVAENVVAMPPMLSACRPAVVVRGKRLLPGQRRCGGPRMYSAGSSRKWVRRADPAAGPCAYARRMGTERGRRRFYAAGWVISAGVMVVTFRMWQLHVREVEQRAEEAERTRDQAAQRKAMEERLRIARELHDSLTHSISVIQVQAGVAVHLARKRGEEAPPALLAIHEAGADAARELRATLGVLRSQDHDASEDCDGSGLGQLDGMLSRARSAGLPVTV